MGTVKQCEHGCNPLGQYLYRGEWYPCPIHGHMTARDLRDGVTEEGQDIYEYMRVPKAFRYNWREDTDAYFEGVEGLKNCNPETVGKLKYIMGEIYNSIAIERRVPEESLYIYGSMINMREWMYMVQRVGLEKCMEVVPALTANELAGVVALQDYPTKAIRTEDDVKVIGGYNRLAAIGADIYLKTGKSYKDYINSDLCFIIETTATSRGIQKVLAGFVEERGLMGKGTYVLGSSYWNRSHPAIEEGCKLMTKLDPCCIAAKKDYRGRVQRDEVKDITDWGRPYNKKETEESVEYPGLI